MNNVSGYFFSDGRVVLAIAAVALFTLSVLIGVVGRRRHQIYSDNLVITGMKIVGFTAVAFGGCWCSAWWPASPRATRSGCTSPTRRTCSTRLFLTIPIYTGYYIVTNWDEMWRSFALMLAGGVLLSIGATILDYTREPEPEGEMFAPVQTRMLPPSAPSGCPMLANLLG